MNARRKALRSFKHSAKTHQKHSIYVSPFIFPSLLQLKGSSNNHFLQHKSPQGWSSLLMALTDQGNMGFGVEQCFDKSSAIVMGGFSQLLLAVPSLKYFFPEQMWQKWQNKDIKVLSQTKFYGGLTMGQDQVVFLLELSYSEELLFSSFSSISRQGYIFCG